jgi:hypothetical protein
MAPKEIVADRRKKRHSNIRISAKPLTDMTIPPEFDSWHFARTADGRRVRLFPIHDVKERTSLAGRHSI